ncbi:coatomer WD associated region-domain-containing protein, partial [Baffinella frigidus]
MLQPQVSTGKWIGDCFVYVSSNDRLNYIVGGEVQTLHHLDRRMYLLGYMAKENRLYMIDKEFNIVSYELLLSVLEYKTCVVRGDFATAATILPAIPADHRNKVFVDIVIACDFATGATILPAIPADHRNKVARFLETQGLKEEALAIATDPDYRFELAIQLKKLEEAYKVVAENASDQKWKQLGDLVIANGDLALAAECLTKANDHAALLLLHSCQGNRKVVEALLQDKFRCPPMGNRKGVEALAVQAADAGKTNVAFLCYFLLGNLEA